MNMYPVSDEAPGPTIVVALYNASDLGWWEKTLPTANMATVGKSLRQVQHSLRCTCNPVFELLVAGILTMKLEPDREKPNRVFSYHSTNCRRLC